MSFLTRSFVSNLRGTQVSFVQSRTIVRLEKTLPLSFRKSFGLPRKRELSFRFLSSFSGKSKAIFSCTSCGHQQVKWTGKCSECGEWNSLEEFVPTTITSPSANPRDKYSLAWVGKGNDIRPGSPGSDGDSLKTLLQVETDPDGWNQTKLEVSDAELSRVLSGGLMAGSLTLLAGSPGVGKSTLALQLAMDLGDSEIHPKEERQSKVLYMAGEESGPQVRQRAERLCEDFDPKGANESKLDRVSILCDSNLETLLEHVSTHSVRALPYKAIIVDSIQVMTLPHESSQPGSVVQVKACATQLLRYAKTSGVPIIMVGHITKGGEIAGPKVLEHLVDVVLNLEGDPNSDHRWLRSRKNRFGANEVGIFELGERGLKGVINPSEMFVSSLRPNEGSNSDEQGLPNGVAWTITTEDSSSTRAFAAEVQALTHDTAHESMPPRSRCYGFHPDRVQLMLAVLSIHANMKELRRQDSFVNIVGGLRLDETGSDLSIAMALASAFYESRIWVDSNGIPPAFIGEVGLGGEIRPVKQIESRISVAQRLGISTVVIPGKTPRVNTEHFDREKNLNIVRVSTVLEAIQFGLNVSPRAKSGGRKAPSGVKRADGLNNNFPTARTTTARSSESKQRNHNKPNAAPVLDPETNVSYNSSYTTGSQMKKSDKAEGKAVVKTKKDADKQAEPSSKEENRFKFKYTSMWEKVGLTSKTIESNNDSIPSVNRNAREKTIRVNERQVKIKSRASLKKDDGARKSLNEYVQIEVQDPVPNQENKSTAEVNKFTSDPFDFSKQFIVNPKGK